jgi:uncharacterized damage-inducible protein DinB
MEMEKLLTHMAWANQQIIGEIKELPAEALGAYAVNPEWTVGLIVRHIASASNWYVWQLINREELNPEELSYWQKRLEDADEGSEKMKDLNFVLELLADSDARLLEQSLLPEAQATVDSEDGTFVVSRSTIISQVVHHATEHRAQAISALEVRGFNSINLDSYDLWSYNSKN